jgi:DNA-binding GntR family transcriptional regulator
VFNVSKKTIKNALDTLADEGIIIYYRGRNGGTFVTGIPADYNKGYTWLALSSDFEPLN